ncbi:MAG: substrate-binding domain-containing protein [Dysgonomonas sp.]|nr:substrate-binding domain-containing protein [Dysgonomonas sp.]
MKASTLFILISTLVLWGMTSCDGPKVTRTDTPTSGVAQIVVDECFAPIIQEQVDVFESINRDATIIPVYTSEIEAFNLFMKDSIRLIIAARELTENEKQIIKSRNQILRSQKLATDGIALIVNKKNNDTIISVSDIKRIMSGEVRSWKDLNPNSNLGEINVVFDSPNSSTVRYIRDSICKDKPLGDNIRARSEDKERAIDLTAQTPNQAVIEYVSQVPGALGVIGVNWISNPSDSTKLSFINNINVMSVSKEDIATEANSYKPFAGYLALQKYPLYRDIHIILSDVRGGLPAGFVAFSAGEKGQRIIYKAGLFPAYQLTRLIRVN